jgi:hypothetical protein
VAETLYCKADKSLINRPGHLDLLTTGKRNSGTKNSGLRGTGV